jgi:hypothetical protein
MEFLLWFLPFLWTQPRLRPGNGGPIDVDPWDPDVTESPREIR